MDHNPRTTSTTHSRSTGTASPAGRPHTCRRARRTLGGTDQPRRLYGQRAGPGWAQIRRGPRIGSGGLRGARCRKAGRRLQEPAQPGILIMRLTKLPSTFNCFGTLWDIAGNTTWSGTGPALCPGWDRARCCKGRGTKPASLHIHPQDETPCVPNWPTAPAGAGTRYLPVALWRPSRTPLVPTRVPPLVPTRSSLASVQDSPGTYQGTSLGTYP